MEVLNKNQRQTAIWRMLGFCLLVLAANAVILFSSYKAFANKGSGEADELRKKLKVTTETAQGNEQHLKTEITELKAQMNALKKENQDLRAGKPLDDKLMKIKDETIKSLERELNTCNTKLANCQ